MSFDLKRRTKSGNNDVTDYSIYRNQYDAFVFDRTAIKSVDHWSMAGWDIPDFHARVRRGELLPHTAFDYRAVTGSTEGYYDAYEGSNRTYSDPRHIKYDAWYPQQGDYEQSYLEQVELNPDFAQEAAAKIYSSGHDTLTFLAELADVRRMFLGVAKGLLRGLDLFPKGFKSISSNWLSYRYGWRTLVYDIASLNEAIIGLDSGRQRYSEKAGTKFVQTFNYVWDESDGNGTRHFAIIDDVTFGCSGSVVADITVPQFQFNPLQTGWELIPFSFVLDWFISVGKMLSAWSFLMYQTNYVASSGFQISCKRNFTMTRTWDPGISGEDYQYGSSVLEIRKRIPCTIPYLPHTRLRLDSFKVLDLLGLIVQRR